MIILGISDNHDSGACLIKDGRIVSATNEERLKREKLTGGFPHLSIEEVLRLSGIIPEEIDFIVVASVMTPTWFLRILDDFHEKLRHQISSFSYLLSIYIIYQVLVHKFRIPVNIEKFLSGKVIQRRFKEMGLKAPVIFVEHHHAHAASAYYTSGCKKELVITLDAMGDAQGITVNIGEGNSIKRIFSQTALNSLSTYYSRVTEFLGFTPFRHEGKVTGLAGYGKYNSDIFGVAKDILYFDKRRRRFKFKSYLIREKKDDRPWQYLKEYNKEDIAYNFQKVFEEELLKFIEVWIEKTGIKNLALAGGMFANVSLNKRISEIQEIDNLYVFPHMGDGGLSVGAALSFSKPAPFYFKNIYFGPAYTNAEVKEVLKRYSVIEYSFKKEDELCSDIARFLQEGKTIAHFNGRMEYGPRALGNRSVLYKADDPSCMDWLNDKLARDSFMPFAPLSLDTEADSLYLNINKIRYSLRFMNVAVDCTKKMKQESPGAVHVDGTARPQVLYREDNQRLYRILEMYKGLKGSATIINTSFNRHEQPIVHSPSDAIHSFLECNLDYLVLNNFLVTKKR